MTLKKIARICLLATAVFLIGDAAGASAVEIMPLKDVKPGMTGTGYSVFYGAKPEPFKATIISVVRKWHGGMDLILARLEGANLEHSGVVAGMSGSPIYIDGKLIGAVAYSWTFSKDPIAGVTPIEAMMKVWDGMSETGYEVGAVDSGSGPPLASAAIHGEFSQLGLAPVSTPLCLSGMDDAAVKYLRDRLAPYNIVPVQSGDSASDEPLPGEDDLQPGSVVGSPIMTGDFQAAVIGTVTARDGDRILAFGHPFMQKGRVSLPLSGGMIHVVLSSVEHSTKMGSVGKVLGALLGDYQPAVAGRIGAKAEMFPVSISVHDIQTGGDQKFNVNITQEESFASTFMMSAMGQAVQKITGGNGDVTVSVSISGRLKENNKEFHYEDMYFQSGGFFAIEPLERVLGMLFNGFRKAHVEELNADIKVSHGRRTADIEGCTLDKPSYHPGDTATAFIRLRPFNGKQITRSVNFQIPESAAPGFVKLSIEGGATNPGNPVMAQPVDFDQLVEQLNTWIPNNTLNLRIIYSPEKALGVGGVELKELPPPVRDSLIVSDPAVSASMFDRYSRETIKADRVITGRYEMNVLITKEFSK